MNFVFGMRINHSKSSQRILNYLSKCALSDSHDLFFFKVLGPPLCIFGTDEPMHFKICMQCDSILFSPAHKKFTLKWVWLGLHDPI